MEYIVIKDHFRSIKDKPTFISDLFKYQWSNNNEVLVSKIVNKRLTYCPVHFLDAICV